MVRTASAYKVFSRGKAGCVAGSSAWIIERNGSEGSAIPQRDAEMHANPAAGTSGEEEIARLHPQVIRAGEALRCSPFVPAFLRRNAANGEAHGVALSLLASGITNPCH